MKHLKRKQALLFGGILCVCVTAITVSLAYSNDHAVLDNEFDTAFYQTVATENFTAPNNWTPCSETAKTFTVKNTSSVGVKVRIKYDEYWRDADDTSKLPSVKDGVTLARVVLQNLNDWELEDGYYYYKYVLQPNDTTSSLFGKVVLDCDADFGAENICTTTTTGTTCEKPADQYEGAKYHLKITAETVQADRATEAWDYYSLMGGREFNVALKTLADNSGTVTIDTLDTRIKSISFVDALPGAIAPSSANRTVVSSGHSSPVYAYLYNDDIYIVTDGKPLYTDEDSSFMFINMSNLRNISFSDNFNTSKAVAMKSMFYNDTALVNLDLPESFDTSNVTDMYAMFYNDTALTSLHLPSTFNTSKVTDMLGLFGRLESLTQLELPEAFDTSQVTTMCQMFAQMSSLTSLEFPEKFTTKNVTDMSYMFFGDTGLTTLELPNTFNTSKVTSMYAMFYRMTALSSLSLPTSFVVNSGTNTEAIFLNVPSTATLNSSADQSVKDLWPGQLGD